MTYIARNRMPGSWKRVNGGERQLSEKELAIWEAGIARIMAEGNTVHVRPWSMENLPLKFCGSNIR